MKNCFNFKCEKSNWHLTEFSHQIKLMEKSRLARLKEKIRFEFVQNGQNHLETSLKFRTQILYLLYHY